MHIAFISYEYPPDTAAGGIATYVKQAVSMLASRGHDVEVFTAGRGRGGTEREDGVLDFAARIAPVFAARHAEAAFDVLEGPEYRAEARNAVRLVPDIALVPGPADAVGGKVLLRRERPFYDYRPAQDPERAHCLDADEIAAPSRAIGEKVRQVWGLDPEKLAYYPLAYVPDEALLRVPLGTETTA
ncbi:MAG: hypothetical protein FRX48_09092 [Lasallia pustulata]|uniref:Glycosyltransferase subfamily 4-like N-terminal domain-containing protein n=1 Tax=Lasallia pustulata TaxID=136370 RepID=A0A5M8PDG5_9LECA|nr:MAG: hypothetical protein FRX48_09092 [Lasallia pustulata]